jgi:nucleoside-diphosphate-sugar epimerase
MADKKFLITGVNGFIGSPLAYALTAKGYEVRGAVRANASCNDTMHEVVEVGDIDGNSDWAKALQDMDVVIHLAARVHEVKETSVSPLEEYLTVNLHGTVNLAIQAASSGVKRFVYTSSIKVNGEQTTGGERFSVSDQPDPKDGYGISKYQAENALLEIGRETGMEIVIVRPPLVYGPGVKANFYSLMRLIDKASPLPFAKISNKRSMIYVGNLVNALTLVATHPLAADKTYLVSDGEDVSTPQLMQVLAKALHKPDMVFPLPLALVRSVARLFGKTAAIDKLTQSLVVDSSRISDELGWQPPYTMAQGIQATVDWYLQSVHSGRG